ncbi:YegP family protein [Lacipirellula sp.]|uniref:YegP family protein n=1 Tax=Lacipirellula sp. TaxID=2691419 RepID=UPI003D13DF77
MEFHVYKDGVGEWRWRLLATNKKIIADSGEGYSAKADCLSGIKSVQGSSGAAVIEDK